MPRLWPRASVAWPPALAVWPRALIVALLAALWASAALAAADFPPLTGRVVDQANILSPVTIADLERKLADLEQKSRIQLVVATVSSLGGEEIEPYANELFRAWKLGDAKDNNGALLLIAPKERKVRIEVGYGLEGTLTDAATKLMIENSILPRFKTGDFSGGIKSGAAAIVQALGGDAATSTTAPTQGSASAVPAWPAILVGLLAVGLLIFCAVTRGGACRGIMQALLIVALSGRGNRASGGTSSFSGGGGSFGGGGSSGSW
jgi:uncharacterized protein